MSEYLAMGGFGAYVWPAYGAFALILGGLAVYAAGRGKAVREELEKIEARRQSGR